ncbi:keratin-associated protein 5-5-like [Sitodiplosis mosellana]|uniref:keratin-associated protein 5-5-like n=1 Tax=Sitodiplosis mosellana TaxID=263140 RepID=UPI0024439AD2|nr:keratin-associated protein 5-5-like [Sitodiplosis mosellana]XP_055313112.1 keratin-associated protein 5-5-like [Sitodiplosis mosellana]XP_055313113.1 keratin-associated protein 5-5-like [Sitodiplosis mosellana]XP_055313114.1 keratin-associated protein 5-5-like [Sitodiplosis mosellana]
MKAFLVIFYFFVLLNCSIVSQYCSYDGQPCESPEDCCGGFCADDGFCGECNTDEDASCSSRCCDGYKCNEFEDICVPCNGDDQPCESPEDCCGGICAVDGFCGECNSDEQPCSPKCCDGYVCNEFEDVCVPCIASGQPCGPDDLCCSGTCPAYGGDCP